MLSSTPAFPTSSQFSSERELQDYCLSVLRSKGIAAQSEVWCGNVRADIVTSNTVMELKKVLDRASIYQAYGQAMVYQKSLNKAQVWIVGQTPTDPKEHATAMTVAREIENDTIKVSFVESDPFWQIAPAAASTRFRLGFLSVIILSALTVSLVSGLGGISWMRSIDTVPGNSAPADPAVPIAPAATAPGSAPPVQTADQVQFCHGQNAPANFRSQPSLDSAIIGSLEPGDTIYLTGQQSADRAWFEVVAPTLANQTGWVAACFIQTN